MIADSRLPPLFRLHAVGPGEDVAAVARGLAAAGADPATLVCADRGDRLDCAVILCPDRPASEAMLAVYVAALAIGDAIGSVVPAGIDLTYRWPNRIAANLGEIASLDVTLPADADPEAVPDWLVVAAVAQVESIGEDWRKGTFPETSLRDEGWDEASVQALLESFSRHLLAWINRWQDDGFEPVRAMWLRHAPSHGDEIHLSLGDEAVRGIFRNIDDDGALVVAHEDRVSRIALADALDRVREPTA